MKLILVHGRNQQGKDPAQLKAQWLAALDAGLQSNGLKLPSDVQVEFPFYGDRLGQFTSQWQIPLSEEITAKGGAVDADYLSFRAELFEGFRQKAGISDDQVNAEYGDNPKPKGPQNWEWVLAILRALDRHVPGMSGGVIDLITHDVFLYIKRMGVRDEIDTLVAAAVPEEPCVVVGHSLGSVVSYSVLRRDPRPLQVRLYVTIGSPLGIQAIRNELRPLKFPDKAANWYNAFDERDVVALYPLDANHFPVQPPVENNATVLNDTPDRHGISGYLGDPLVARRIYDALI